MQIHLKKGRDGPDVLTCTRADGTQTWKRLQTSLAVHDLVHFALEHELGLRSGFFGLIASGTSVSDFESREARGKLPPDPAGVEYLVGRLWQEVFDGACPDAAEFNATSDSIAAAHPGATVRHLTQAELDRVRGARDALVVRWRDVKPGESMELCFAPGIASPVAPTRR